jgi:hypothetical protein
VELLSAAVSHLPAQQLRGTQQALLACPLPPPCLSPQKHQPPSISDNTYLNPRPARPLESSSGTMRTRCLTSCSSQSGTTQSLLEKSVCTRYSWRQFEEFLYQSQVHVLVAAKILQRRRNSLTSDRGHGLPYSQRTPPSALVQWMCEELEICAGPRPWRGLRQRTLWGHSHVGAGRRQGFAAPRPWRDWRRRALGGHIHNGARWCRSTSTLRQEDCCPASRSPVLSVAAVLWRGMDRWTTSPRVYVVDHAVHLEPPLALGAGSTTGLASFSALAVVPC